MFTLHCLHGSSGFWLLSEPPGNHSAHLNLQHNACNDPGWLTLCNIYTSVGSANSLLRGSGTSCRKRNSLCNPGRQIGTFQLVLFGMILLNLIYPNFDLPSGIQCLSMMRMFHSGG
jgi:hypothetical protein